MNIPVLALHECQRRGLTLDVVDGQLRVRGPSDALDSRLASYLSSHASQIIRTLSEDSGPWVPGVVPGSGGLGPTENGLNQGISFISGPLVPEKKRVREQQRKIIPWSKEGLKEERKYRGSVRRGEISGDLGPDRHQVFDSTKLTDGPRVGPDLDTRPTPEILWPEACPDNISITIPRDWRRTVSTWPMPRWLAWRSRSAELQPPSPTADEIRAADHAAYLELSTPTGATP